MKKFKVVLLVVCLFVLTGCTNSTGTSIGKDSVIKIAMIDTGISTKAIHTKNLVKGKNYILPEQDTEDRIGHGTNLSSLIVGSTRANVEGICPDAILVPLVYYSEEESGEEVIGDTGLMSNIIRDAVNEYSCDIICISSVTQKEDKELERAIRYATKKDVLVVACAGNDGDETIYYPGAYEDVLCVGSVNEDKTGRADFSQKNDSVDLLAPGIDLQVATRKGNALTVFGTSYSAAYVSGKAAKLWINNPDMTVAQLKSELYSQAKPINSEDTTGCGAGFLE